MPSEPQRLTEYRLDKLEEAIVKLVANHEILTRIEMAAFANAEAIKAIDARVDYQGKTMDGWSQDIASLKTTQHFHSWAWKTIAGAVIAVVVAAVVIL